MNTSPPVSGLGGVGQSDMKTLLMGVEDSVITLVNGLSTLQASYSAPKYLLRSNVNIGSHEDLDMNVESSFNHNRKHWKYPNAHQQVNR